MKDIEKELINYLFAKELVINNDKIMDAIIDFIKEATSDSKPYLKPLYIETLIEKYKMAESIAENNVYRGIYAIFAKELQDLREI